MFGSIKDFFDEESDDQAKQIQSLIQADDSKGDIAEILKGIDFSKWSNLAYDTQVSLSAIFKDGGESAIVQVGEGENKDAFYVVNQDAEDFAKDRAAELVGMKYVDGELVENPNADWAITESTRDMIRGTVTQAQSEGWSTDQIADALKENYVFSDARAENIARTESARADIAGSMAGYRASGVVAQKQWIVGAECCDDCQELDGVTVDLDEDFPNDGGDGPPLHPQCRCDVLPVVSDDETNDQ